MEEQNILDSAQADLDAEQQGEPGSQISSVTREEFDQMKRELESRIRGMQSSFDRARHEIESYKKDAQTNSQVQKWQAMKEQTDDPVAQQLLDDKIAELQRQAQASSPQEPANQSQGQGASSNGNDQGIMASAQDALRRMGINPETPGIDWSQNLSTPAGQEAFFASAVEADRAALRQTLSRRPAQQQDQTANPPVESGATGGGYRSREEALNALITGQVPYEKQREVRRQYNI